MSLLRSARLAPGRDLGAAVDDDAGSDLFTFVEISPCQTFVSNDPTEGENVKRTPCNITSFSCYDVAEEDTSSSGATAATTGPSRVSVDFDYELWLTESANINATILELESSMLQHLAKVFNLLDCPYVSSSGSTATTRTAAGGGGRGRHLQIFGDELANLFVGVDSTPVDVPDENQKECIVPVMASDKVSAICQPMKGSFSASVNADVTQDSMAEASIKSGLLRLLRLGMNEDLYVVNDVRKVSFIGDRTSYNPPPPVMSSSAPAARSLGNAALAFIIIAALIAFLIAGFLVGRNRKRKREERPKGMVLDEGLSLDEEAGTSYNEGKSPFDGYRGDADVDGSLAATDELKLQPQALVVPVLSRSSEAGSGPEEVSENSQVKAASAEANSSPEQKSAAARELAVALEMATAAAASAEKAGEQVTGAKLNGSAAETPAPKKKKKRKKRARRATDSPDSLLSDSLRKLDSIAEESEPSVIDEPSDSSTRSLT